MMRWLWRAIACSVFFVRAPRIARDYAGDAKRQPRVLFNRWSSSSCERNWPLLPQSCSDRRCFRRYYDAVCRCRWWCNRNMRAINKLLYLRQLIWFVVVAAEDWYNHHCYLAMFAATRALLFDYCINQYGVASSLTTLNEYVRITYRTHIISHSSIVCVRVCGDSKWMVKKTM